MIEDGITLVESKILTLRGQRVILDSDLAALYDIPTFRLNEAVKRKRGRFPSDFAFQVTRQEFTSLISQNAISKRPGRGGHRKLPWVFTEHGAVMAANVLNSLKAVNMSVFVVRAFMKMREQLLSRAELEARLTQIENVLLSHDDKIRELYRQIRPLLLPPPEPPPKKIGFGVRESPARYSGKKKRAKGQPLNPVKGILSSSC
jgi:hypothetical protein